MFSKNSSLKCIFQFKNVSRTCNLERCKINSGISILEYNTYVLVKQSINSHPICISDFLIWYNYQIEKKIMNLLETSPTKERMWTGFQVPKPLIFFVGESSESILFSFVLSFYSSKSMIKFGKADNCFADFFGPCYLYPLLLFMHWKLFFEILFDKKYP